MANYSAKSTVVLEVNGQQAKKMLDDVRKKVDNCEKSLEACMRAGDKLGADKWRKELKKARKELALMEFSIHGVKDVLDNLDKAPLGQLKKTLTTLRRQLQGLDRNSEQWKRTVENIRRVKAEIDKVNASMLFAPGIQA